MCCSPGILKLWPEAWVECRDKKPRYCHLTITLSVEVSVTDGEPANGDGADTRGMPRLIALDWGTSSFRALLLGANGAVLDRLARPMGILKVPDGDFDAAFETAVGPWLDVHGPLPVIASGMIGSRQGWREAPYVACPAGAAELARDLIPVETRKGRTVRLVPGLTDRDAASVPDVMRGEETQILGTLDGGMESGLYVLPGTHSKWVQVEDGRITGFATYMTGEMFAVLREHSILGRLMTGNAHDAQAFQRGLDTAASGEATGGLLHRLFGARTLGLFGALSPESIGAYLSGLLIGTEIADALAAFPPNGKSITLIAEPHLTELYGQALGVRGLAAVAGPADAVAHGLWRIAVLAALIADTPAHSGSNP
jgi:2-dehydro-3-deoxygalactonokinase